MLLLAVALLAAGRDIFVDEAGASAKKESRMLQGTWQVVKFVDQSEEAAPSAEIEHFTFEFHGQGLIDEVE